MARAPLVLALGIHVERCHDVLGGLRQMFGLRLFQSDQLPARGNSGSPCIAIPILAAHVGLCLSMALWPAQKNLGMLISYSAAVMLGTQFWHAHSGGLALAWYLPLLLLTIFRPNLGGPHGDGGREITTRGTEDIGCSVNAKFDSHVSCLCASSVNPPSTHRGARRPRCCFAWAASQRRHWSWS